MGLQLDNGKVVRMLTLNSTDQRSILTDVCGFIIQV